MSKFIIRLKQTICSIILLLMLYATPSGFNIIVLDGEGYGSHLVKIIGSIIIIAIMTTIIICILISIVYIIDWLLDWNYKILNKNKKVK